MQRLKLHMYSFSTSNSLTYLTLRRMLARCKRQRALRECDGPSHTKRHCIPEVCPSPPSTSQDTRDRLSSLSDEIVLRIFSYLSIPTLLDVSLVSHHLNRLASDSHIWRAHYYSRFVLPRALRIPGFRDGSKRHGSRLHYSARRTFWADGGGGRQGGLVDMGRRGTGGDGPSVDWKRQYKLRHNWARGKATVEELDMSGDETAPRRTLVKVVEGIAVTADTSSGLRAWDLRTKAQIVQTALQDDDDQVPEPTCLAVDDQLLGVGKLDICLGFLDGSFGIWRLDLRRNEMERRYRHVKSSSGELIGVAYQHPFLLTATDSVLISLYDFDGAFHDRKTPVRRRKVRPSSRTPGVGSGAGILDIGYESDESDELVEDDTAGNSASLPSPLLVTSLKSHTSRAPLALSIRRMASSVVASIAYTFLNREGWSIGIQDLHIRQSQTDRSEVASSRLAYALPVRSSQGYASPPATPSRQPEGSLLRSPNSTTASPDGPTRLCYSHPYLLATLPDNTLVLHVCTSNATALSMSPGIRLWGHTSGISDAEITARGKAVSVSCRGEEIRVWELEGRAGGNSIEVRPSVNQDDRDLGGGEELAVRADEWDNRRNWVGFDDEMVIVLKEARGGRESLVVYDFT
ncbi:F-box domain-containing protein [Sodiomyces alkalinus F11]|uniref:F-box domain-containing protein n=1 Tax=Sodiomyces alkalinus (strain CBS 110278 / VKM F-3762 / F11) TaxID=1314773 RepID=A0A3N2Q494_SODAK|nr:F-box domain-containing protein [Sodiomyces alkalinus F11]ROT41593.1 F-box domain-containing protein [Sodiomyces alkalinus F11]